MTRLWTTRVLFSLRTIAVLVLALSAIAPAHAARCENDLNTPKKIRWAGIDLIPIIQAIAADGIPLNSQAVEKTHAAKVEKLLLKKFKLKTTGSAFRNAVHKRYGSWDKGLLAAGFDPLEHKEHQTINWTEKMFCAGLKALYDAGVPVNASALQEDQSERSRKILVQELKVITTPKGLYNAGMDLFNAWDKALGFCELPASEIMKIASTVELSEGEIKKTLQCLSKKLPDMKSTTLIRHSDEVKHEVYKCIGRVIRGSQVFKEAKRVFGSWFNAVQAAGLPVDQLRFENDNVNWTPGLVLDLIRVLNKARLPVRTFTRLITQTRKVKAAIIKEYNIPVSFFHLFREANRFFGSWKNAVAQAGYEGPKPKRGRRVSNFILEAHQTERQILDDGSVRYNTVLGGLEPSPEENLLREDSERHFQNVTAGLPDEQSELVTALLAYLEEHDGLENQAEVLAYLRQSTGREVTWEQAAAVLEVLAGKLADED